ncbi:MAG TPA: hypothetical protein EYG17_08635 [Acidimicrobiia bacterium]|jgi:hypothetical protein|nr:hypothetical protein [Acidimicrobiia bacterium]HIL06100.1 hypothetical protein [Acidimicrobiia bacterium]
MNELQEIFAAQNMEPTAAIEATWPVAVSASDVWAAISESGNLTNVHPFCSTNEVERWPGPGGRDHVRYYSGVHYQRDVLHWSEGSGYDLIVGPPPNPTAVATWWIAPSSATSCKFGIKVISYVRSDVDPIARENYEEKVIRTAIPPYLHGVVQGVAHYAETGNPVKRNQFGAHDIYSPEVQTRR